MNEDLIQTLANIKKQLDTELPAAIKKLSDSPEMKRIVEISQKAQETIPAVLTQFVETAAPYVQAMNEGLIKITPYLVKLAEASARLNVIYRLGNVGYVAWKNFPDEFYEQAYKTQTDKGLMDCIYDWLVEKRFMDVEDKLKEIGANEHLKDNPVLLQAADAYRRGDYDIAALGFTAMVDRILSEATGLVTNTNVKRRVEEITKKIEANGENSLDEPEINDYILISTYTNAMQLFGADSRFNEAEPDLNRHWIMHGRVNRKMEQMDCIRIINILYGTILMGRMGEIGAK